jgi:16S rRNA (cytosine1402-N4)-methyltransferase
MESLYHKPVLLKESLEYLLGNKEKSLVKTYVDCTLGGGGYTKKILELTSSDTKVIAIDRDAHAIDHCKVLLNDFSGRIVYARNNFAEIAEVLGSGNVDKISGIVMDLGLSSYQLNNEEGFSYQKDTKLDMRADNTQRLTAADVLNDYDEKELLKIFKEYGELRYNRQITRDIAEQRRKKRFETTFDLVELLKEKIPPRYINKDLSKVFQAIRIEVNGELDNLKKVLEDSARFLEEGARIVVISYHSLEDRIVKNFFRLNVHKDFKILTKRPVMAQDEEIGSNTRARSAKLRAAEKK